MTTFVDSPLAARIDAAQASQLERLVRVVAERLPRHGAAGLSVGGGWAAFLAPHAATSRAVGLAMHGPIEAADVDALERFYRDRDTEARILVSPFADASLFAHLGARGFRLVHLDTVLIRRIDPTERFAEPPAGVAVRWAAIEDAAAWVRVSLTGFAPPGEAPALASAPFFEAGFHEPGFSFATATVSGVVAGAAALDVHAATAHFFADSTLPELRGRGAQGALIAARLARARAAGCDLALAVTQAGSPSQRNYERAGFAPAYSQALLIKHFDDGRR